MNEIIATEQVFSPTGILVCIKYHYENGNMKTIGKIQTKLSPTSPVFSKIRKLYNWKKRK